MISSHPLFDPELDLYVIQNEYGLIKIGASRDFAKRLAAIKKKDCCKAVLVSVHLSEGHREFGYHYRLRRYALGHEWFDGTDACRLAVERVLNKGLPFRWHHPLDVNFGNSWMDRLYERRAKAAEAEYRRTGTRWRC